MITQKYIKKHGLVELTFEIAPHELPEDLEISSVTVVGSFNAWDETATPLKRMAGEVWRGRVRVTPGTACEFRYLANGQVWFNDWQAEAYQPNTFGSDNCIVQTLDSAEA